MKAKEYSVFEGGERNYHQPVNASEQTIHRGSSIGVCSRNEELSSINRDVQQTGEHLCCYHVVIISMIFWLGQN